MYKSYLGKALNASKITESDIDRAVSRILTQYIALGELESPEDVVFRSYGPEQVDTRAHRLLSLEVAQQSMTLLKNEVTATGELATEKAQNCFAGLRQTLH